jgi:histo-blood group ABO system transferase
MKKIGLLIIATNKYVRFLDSLIESADKWFLPNQDVTYFIFTNQDIKINSNRKYVISNVQHKEWPWMTLGRYDIFKSNNTLFNDMDYLFYSDVDMKFVGVVGDEILSDRVATQHPYYYNRRGTPETNPISTACVHPHEQMQYFAGGFNGGTKENYLNMCETISNNINKDLEKNFIAVWHDESHMNRYMIDNPPTKILNPSYCYPESINMPFEKKLLALDKNHNEMRS